MRQKRPCGQQALDAATACATAGVKAAIVASTGFAEAGSEGAERQLALKALTQRYGIRFVGPNTNAGIRSVPRLLVGRAAAAVTFAESVGWPVVLKGVVDRVAHKSDVGLVRLNIESPAMLTTEYDSLRKIICGLAGSAASASICVQKMVSGGLEVIAGVTKEIPLGHFVLVGLGGRFAEQIDDVHLWAIPASEPAIREQLETTAVGRILRSPRWTRRESFDELIGVLMRLQDMALKEADDMQAVEINPLWLGNGAPVALDALVIRKQARPRHE